MSPQLQALSPQPTTTNPQGVASVTPISQPTPPQMPTGPSPAVAPQVATPNFDTSGTMNALANYYQIPRQTAAITGAGQAQGAVAQQQFEQQKYQRNIQIQNQKDQLDPSKYNITRNPQTGGVNILNSVGDKVDIGTYSNLTGANPADTLKNSTDPNDKAFVQAYNNLQDFVQTKIAATNGDEQAKIKLGDYYANNSGLQNMELGQIQDLFMKRYGNYFGQPQQQNMPGTPGLTNTVGNLNSPIASSPYYQMQSYPQLANPNPTTDKLLGGSGIADQLAQLSQQQTGK